MKKYILITFLLLSICMSTSAQKKENTSEYFSALGQKALAAGKIDEAKAFWKQARQAKQISVEEICLGGDIYMKQTDTESAIKQYRRAVFFDRHNPMGYMKLAGVLKKNNIEQAVSLLDTLRQLRPDLKVEYKIADLYYDMGDYKGALAVYDSLKIDAMPDTALVHYAASAYLTRHYQQSLDLSTTGHVRNSRNVVFNRFRLYNSTELEKYRDAVEAANDLFYNSDSLKAQYMDYLYYGYALNGYGRNADAVAQFNKAIEMSKGVADITEQISGAYLRIGRYDEAAMYYEKFIASKTDNNNKVYDTYRLGSIWWQKANNDTTLTPEEKIATLKKADAVFQQITVYEPKNYVGYYWQGKINATIDADCKLGLAKPYYVKVIELTANDASHKSAYTESCNYMAYYNYLKKNYRGAYEYAQKVLAVDPDDSYAFQLSEATKNSK